MLRCVSLCPSAAARSLRFPDQELFEIVRFVKVSLHGGWVSTAAFLLGLRSLFTRGKFAARGPFQELDQY